MQLQWNPQLRYYFICVCGKSKILNSGSVRRHYGSCLAVRRQVLPARMVQDASESSGNSPSSSTSDVESLPHDPRPSASPVSGAVPESDSTFISLNVHNKSNEHKKKVKITSKIRILVNSQYLEQMMIQLKRVDESMANMTKEMQ